MSFADYGLDDNKRSQDPGDKTKKFFDPWLREEVSGRNFYLCFSNWVISRRTIEAFKQQEPVESIPGDQCQKCLKKVEFMHYDITGLHEEPPGIELGICSDCLDAAASYLDKDPPTIEPSVGLASTKPAKKATARKKPDPQPAPEPPPGGPARFAVVNGVTYHNGAEFEIIIPELATVKAKLRICKDDSNRDKYLDFRGAEIDGFFTSITYSVSRSSVQNLFVMLWDREDKLRKARRPAIFYFDATLSGHVITASILRRTNISDQNRGVEPTIQPVIPPPDPEPIVEPIVEPAKVDPAQVVQYLRFWRKQPGVEINNGQELGVLHGTHSPNVVLSDGSIFILAWPGDHQRAKECHMRLLAAQKATEPIPSGAQLSLF